MYCKIDEVIIIKRFTEQEIDKQLKKINLIRISEYKGMSNKCSLIDDEGYKYYAQLGNLIYGNYKPKRFYNKNPYTIENINTYIRKNNISCELLSNQYINKDDDLLWKCGCGNTFKRCWSKFQQGQITCLDCANRRVQDAKYLGLDYLRNQLKDMGLIYIEGSTKQYSDGCYAFTPDGYIVHVGRNCLHKNSTPDILSKYNKFSIYNMNRYFDLYRNGEYKCLDERYLTNTQYLNIKHIKCGKTFKSPWCDMRYHNNERGHRVARQCPYCYKGTLESYHACVLKQVFKHEFPNTILEDKSCINPLTHRPLPTDIVNHENKIAIEIQSKFHEKEYQQFKDQIKRNYWVNNGYNFYALDIRDYTVVQMIQLFFPNISEIPNYVKTSSENIDRYIIAQDLINSKKYNNIEIAKKLNISVQSLYYWNRKGKINLQYEKIKCCELN